MRNLFVVFLFLFSLNCFAQDNTNSIDFEFDTNYINSTPSLYLKCANDIRFSIFDATNLEKLEYKVTGADLIVEDKSNHIVLIPNASKVTLEVLYHGKTIKEQDFKVKLIPKPILKVEQISEEALTSFPQKLDVYVLPDTTFIKESPRDARYRVNYTVTLAKGKEIITKKEFKEGEQFTREEVNNYTQLLKAEPKEDWKLIVEVKEIQRMNYKDESEKVNLNYSGSEEYFILPIELN